MSLLVFLMKIGDDLIIFDRLKSSLYYRKHDFVTGAWKHLVLIFLHPKCQFSKKIIEELNYIQIRFNEHIEIIGLQIPLNAITNNFTNSNDQEINNNLNFKILDNVPIEIIAKYEISIIPQALVFKNKKLVYKGAINDNPLEPEKIKHHYLTEVLEKIMRNLKFVPFYPPIGTKLEN
ncbi:MAG: hypothetical protein HeimC3_20830 [Candidatus Heimdallarchaeota archaeon LC_3]|nr:MAG: hypothetical protein HeimC3_20830 [Candidatus Heimdallarchaeota archaeon LC_3]